MSETLFIEESDYKNVVLPEEVGIINKNCPFCGYKYTVDFHEHYHFCPECTAMWTRSILQKRSCNHINDHSLEVMREPWYRKVRKNMVYIVTDRDGTQKCSKCGKGCISDGW